MAPESPERVVRCRVLEIRSDQAIVHDIDATEHVYRVPQSDYNSSRILEIGEELDCAVILECVSDNLGLASLRRGSHWRAQSALGKHTDQGAFEMAQVTAVTRDVIHLRLSSGVVASCPLSASDRQHSVDTQVRVRVGEVNPWINGVQVTLADEVEEILSKYPVGTTLLVRPTLRLSRGAFATDGVVTGFIHRPTNQHLGTSFDDAVNLNSDLKVVIAARNGAWLVFELDGLSKDQLFYRFVQEHERGDVMIGIIQRQVAYGYFIAIDGLSCLAHISEQSAEEQHRHRRKERAEGTSVQVQVKAIDVVKMRISLVILEGSLS